MSGGGGGVVWGQGGHMSGRKGDRSEVGFPPLGTDRLELQETGKKWCNRADETLPSLSFSVSTHTNTQCAFSVLSLFVFDVFIPNYCIQQQRLWCNFIPNVSLSTSTYEASFEWEWITGTHCRLLQLILSEAAQNSGCHGFCLVSFLRREGFLSPILCGKGNSNFPLLDDITYTSLSLSVSLTRGPRLLARHITLTPSHFSHHPLAVHHL